MYGIKKTGILIAQRSQKLASTFKLREVKFEVTVTSYLVLDVIISSY